MGLFIIWIALTIVVTALGDQRKIGSLAAFFISLFLSPLIGFLAVLASKRKDTEKFEQALLSKADRDKDTYIDDLYKLKQLYDSGAINEGAYRREMEVIESKKIRDIYIYDSSGKGYSIIMKGMERFVKIPKDKETPLSLKIQGYRVSVVISKPGFVSKEERMILDMSKSVDGYVDISKLV